MKSLVLSVGICLFWAMSAASQQVCDAIASPLTFEKLAEKLRDCRIHRIEQLLPLLPADFRSRYVLVYASRSLQGASPTFPRVIMFGLDARFIIAFSGDPDLAGYDLLETIEFDDREKKFRFHSITFPEERKSSSVIQEPAPVISEENPAKCMSCHRKDLRPNWDTYAAWPGVYGSNNDSMPAAEREQYQKFKKDIYLKIGRYRFLEDAEQYPDSAWYYDYYTARPNLQFNWLLSLLNSQTISNAIKENPKLHPYRYALLGALTCHEDLKDPIMPAQYVLSQVLVGSRISYDHVSQEVLQSVQASYAEREKRQCLLLNSLGSNVPISNWECRFKPKEIDPAINTSRFRYIMEIAGVPFPKEWSMEFGSEHYVFYAGEVGEVGELGLFLWRDLLDPVKDREIYQIYQLAWENRKSRGYMVFRTGKEEVCRFLNEKSLEALSLN